MQRYRDKKIRVCDKNSISLACLGVRLFVSNKRQNGWTDRPKFCVGPHLTLGNNQNFKHLCLKVFCCKILKMREKILWNQLKKFMFFFILYKDKMLTDKATIKSWNRICKMCINLLISITTATLVWKKMLTQNTFN